MYKSLLSRCCHLVMNIVKIEVYRIKRYVSFVSNQDQLAVSANTPPLLAGGGVLSDLTLKGRNRMGWLDLFRNHPRFAATPGWFLS